MFKSIDTSQNGGFDAITFGNNKRGKVKGLGKIAISNDMSISNVLLVESLDFNLLSIAQFCDLSFKCIFGSDDVEVVSVDGTNKIFKGFRHGSLYLVDFNDSETQLMSVFGPEGVLKQRVNAACLFPGWGYKENTRGFILVRAKEGPTSSGGKKFVFPCTEVLV
jgi:hypothetical protein